MNTIIACHLKMLHSIDDELARPRKSLHLRQRRCIALLAHVRAA